MSLNPYEPPRAPTRNRADADLAEHSLPATREGDLLKLGRWTKLRPFCVGCGTDERVKFSEKLFFFTPGPAYALVLLGLLAVLFVMLGIQKTARIKLPYCAKCKAVASRAEALQGPVVIGSMVFGFGAATAAGNGAPRLGLTVLVLGSLAVGIAYWKWIRAPIRSVHIDAETITLKGVHSIALERLTA